MTSLLRLFGTLRVLLRYNLIALVPPATLPWPAKTLLRFINLFASNDLRAEEVRVRLALEELGPIYIKFGQLLSTRRDLLPTNLANELAKLQDDVPPFPNEVASQIIERSIGKSIPETFSSIESEPLASASVAQVYKATLYKNGRYNGEDVIIKVIRPGIEKTIAKDTRLMARLAKLLDRYSSEAKRLHLPEVVADYKTTIEAELDLKQEAANTSQLRRNFVESEQYKHLLVVPDVYWDFCSENVLVADFMDGFPISDEESLTKHSIDRSQLAARGVEIFFTQVFKHNFFHADMHPGNIFIDTSDAANPRYVALDCAIMGSLSEQDSFNVARILLAAFNREYDQVAKLCLQAQWVSPDTRLSAFASVIRSVCEPIFSKPLAEISFGTLLIYLFRAARKFGMDVQPSLILLQKTLVNIEGLGRDLYPDLDLWATAQPFLQHWVTENYSPAATVQTFVERLENTPPSTLIDNLISTVTRDNAAPALLKQLEQQQNDIDKLGKALMHTRWLLAIAVIVTVWQVF